MNEITVDVNVLKKTERTDSDHYLEAIDALVIIKKKMYLCFDIENHLQQCYYTSLVAKSYASVWLAKMIKDNKIRYYSSNIKTVCVRTLENMNFHMKDLIYVKIAANSSEKKALSDDPTFHEQQIKNYLLEELKVETLTIDQFNNAVSKSV